MHELKHRASSNARKFGGFVAASNFFYSSFDLIVAKKEERHRETNAEDEVKMRFVLVINLLDVI